MALKVCAEPGCPSLQPEARCKTHRQAQERARGSRQARGYGTRHEVLRRRYQQRMTNGETFNCWRCGDPINPNLWHLGHDDNNRNQYRGPECVPCNTATAGR